MIRRCGADTRQGAPCQAAAIRGRKRCRLHGGATGAGAPKGNRNALKHGAYTAEARALRKRIREMVRRMRDVDS